MIESFGQGGAAGWDVLKKTKQSREFEGRARRHKKWNQLIGCEIGLRPPVGRRRRKTYGIQALENLTALSVFGAGSVKGIGANFGARPVFKV